jgi:hypothetical protein
MDAIPTFLAVGMIGVGVEGRGEGERVRVALARLGNAVGEIGDVGLELGVQAVNTRTIRSIGAQNHERICFKRMYIEQSFILCRDIIRIILIA